MREHIYRGKRKDNGEWVEGYLTICNEEINYGKVYMCDSVKSIYFNGDTFEIGDFYEVDPNTVGEYTGLTDKNGKKIFEGDILKCVSEDYGEYITTVSAIGTTLCVDMVNSDYDYTAIDFATEDWDGMSYEIEVIGNVTDNPELLEVQK